MIESLPTRTSGAELPKALKRPLKQGMETLLVARAVDDGHGNPLEEPDWPIDIHSRFLACPDCGQGFRPLEPREFHSTAHSAGVRSVMALGHEQVLNISH